MAGPAEGRRRGPDRLSCCVDAGRTTGSTASSAATPRMPTPRATYDLWSASLTDPSDVRDEGLTVGDLAFTDDLDGVDRLDQRRRRAGARA